MCRWYFLKIRLALFLNLSFNDYFQIQNFFQNNKKSLVCLHSTFRTPHLPFDTEDVTSMLLILDYIASIFITYTLSNLFGDFPYTFGFKMVNKWIKYPIRQQILRKSIHFLWRSTTFSPNGRSLENTVWEFTHKQSWLQYFPYPKINNHVNILT